MKPLKVVKYPNPILRKKCSEVRKETNWEEVKDLSTKMHRTMHFYEGIGLAAPQVGVSLRMFVMQVGAGESFTFINPAVVDTDEEESFECQEGCLSFPLGIAYVTRPKRVKITYTDLNKKIQTKVFEDLESTCVQHELDHLDGKLFIDRMSRLSKDVIVRKMKKRGLI